MNVRSVLPPDAIPSVDDPTLGPDYFGDDGDEVIVVDLPGAAARAYAVRILHYHEIVNDVVRSGAPVGQPESRDDSGDVVDRRPVAESLSFQGDSSKFQSYRETQTGGN